MKRGLLIVERIVIESLSKKEMTFNELEQDTGLERRLLLSILHYLRESCVVKKEREFFSIDRTNLVEWLTVVNAKEHVKEEVKEIFVNLVNDYFAEERDSSQVKVKKIFLTRPEKKEVDRMFRSIECFFENVTLSRKRAPLKENTGEQEIVVWGTSKYSNIVEGSLAV